MTVGFNTLRRFIKEIYAREDRNGPLNLKSVARVHPKFKINVMSKLNITESDFKGLVSVLHRLDLVDNRGRLVPGIDNISKLHNIIIQSNTVKKTLMYIRKLSLELIRMNRYKNDAVTALSFVGELYRELGRRIIAVPGNKTPYATAIFLNILRSIVPFVIVPASPVYSYSRHVNAIITTLEELGGLTRVRELLEQSLNVDRFGSGEEFLKALGSSMALYDIIKPYAEEGRSKRFRIAATRFLRAEGDYENTSVDRVNSFIDRIIYSANIKESAKRVGFKAENENMMRKEILMLIDESVARDPEEFMNAYGDVKVGFTNIEDIRDDLARRITRL